MLHAFADVGQMLSGFALLIAVIALIREMRSQNLQSLFYLHQYLAQDDFSEARRRVRTRLHAVAYGAWTEIDRAAASKVCASYDQAGLLLSAGVLSDRTRKLFLDSSWGESVCDQYEALRPFLAEQQTPTRTGVEFFKHFSDLYAESAHFHRPASSPGDVMQVARVVSGGQTGADRAALDVAIESGLQYGGWCPRGGWAEDLTAPPGLLVEYPDLRETSSDDPAERTELNVRDSDATLIVRLPGSTSPGTDLTLDTAARLGRPVLVTEGDAAQVSDWLGSLSPGIRLNVAGPRESEQPGLYDLTRELLRVALVDRRS